MFVTSNVRFEKTEQIGKTEGKNSKVFKGRDTQLDAPVVIKQIPKSDFADFDEYFAEAQMLYDSRHPNIARVMYASADGGDDQSEEGGAEKGYVYLIMPEYERGSLSALMSKRFLTVREIIRYGLDLLTGLHHVHTLGLIHFDIKPTNVLLDLTDRALLTDFGLSKYANEHGFASQPVLYGKHWPPEFAKGQVDLTQAADIYQAGVTLYRMCNRYEFERQIEQKKRQGTLFRAMQDGEMLDRKWYLPHIPRRLQKIIARAMDPNPDKRWDSVLEMMNALATVDNMLDWTTTRDQADMGAWVWRNVEETHVKEVRMSYNFDDKSWTVRATKTMHDSKRTTRITAGCKAGFPGDNREDVHKFIHDFMHQHT